MVKAGGKTWFFLTADYAFGTSLQSDTADGGEGRGGTVVGAVQPSAERRATSRPSCCRRSRSKAQILGLANAGGDTINAMKAANEFGITKTMKLAGLLMFINDVHSLGLKTTAGHVPDRQLVLEPERRARAWSSQRFFEKIKRMPSSLQAADYSAGVALPEGGRRPIKSRRRRQGAWRR